MSGWLVLDGSLTENASAVALIDEKALRAAAGWNAEIVEVRQDPRRYNFVIQVIGVGGATSVDVEVLGPGGLWSTWDTGKVAGDTVVISTGWWRQIRLTWTGGTPDATGTAAFEASPKFNGLA